MSEPHEPSYYEIALTNRQVLIAFVMLLGSVLVAFLCGVWVGRGGGPVRAAESPLGGEKPAAEQVAELEELGFFAGDGHPLPPPSAEPLDKPDLGRLATEPKRETTLAEDLGTTVPPPSSRDPATGDPATREPAIREPASDPGDEPIEEEPPPLAVPASPPPSPPVRPTSPSPAPAQEGFIIQVFSTRDEPQALRVLSQLKNAGYQAFLSSVAGSGPAMHRVRIGPFTDRVRAESTARKVNEQFKLDTWITAASN